MISKISAVNYGNTRPMKRVNLGYTEYEIVNNNPNAFYGMSDSRKLNVIFDMLKDVRANQENAYETITENQHKLHNASYNAFMTVANSGQQMRQVRDTFERNRVGQIPSMPVFRPDEPQM